MSLQEKSIILASQIMTSHQSIIVTFLLSDRHHNSVCGKQKVATRTRLVMNRWMMKRFGQCKATRDNKEVISNTPLGVVRWCEKFRASRLHPDICLLCNCDSTWWRWESMPPNLKWPPARPVSCRQDSCLKILSSELLQAQINSQFLCPRHTRPSRLLGEIWRHSRDSNSSASVRGVV